MVVLLTLVTIRAYQKHYKAKMCLHISTKQASLNASMDLSKVSKGCIKGVENIYKRCTKGVKNES